MTSKYKLTYRQYRHNNNEYIKAYKRDYARRYRQNPINKEKLRLSARDRRSRWSDERKERQKIINLEGMKRHRERLREQIYMTLGHMCVVCGFSDKRALQFDHINGGGTKEQKTLGSMGMLRYYSKNPTETKSKLQVLCANCNSIKRHKKAENNVGIVSLK